MQTFAEFEEAIGLVFWRGSVASTRRLPPLGLHSPDPQGGGLRCSVGFSSGPVGGILKCGVTSEWSTARRVVFPYGTSRSCSLDLLFLQQTHRRIEPSAAAAVGADEKALFGPLELDENRFSNPHPLQTCLGVCPKSFLPANSNTPEEAQ